MAVMASGERKGWLSYLSLGYLGKEDTTIQITPFTALPEGPGLYRIHEPINAAVEYVVGSSSNMIESGEFEN